MQGGHSIFAMKFQEYPICSPGVFFANTGRSLMLICFIPSNFHGYHASTTPTIGINLKNSEIKGLMVWMI